MASRAALLLCAAVCLFATAMAAEEFADLAELNTPLTDSIFHPETMVKIASDDKYGYYKRVHKKSSKGKGYKEEEHKKTEYKPKKAEHKKEEHKEEHKKEDKKPEDNEYPPEGETYEKDGYELVDGYYYHGEPKNKEYKDYEAEYPEYSNYPDKFLPKVCIQSLPSAANKNQQDKLINWLNSTALTGPTSGSIGITWEFGCCCHGEDEGYSKEYKPSYDDKDYGDYLTNGYGGKHESDPSVCDPKKIGSCELTFTAGGILKHLSPNCDKLNVTVTGTCKITEKEAKKCIPFGHYDGDEEVEFDISSGHLFKIGVGIPTPGANVGSYDSDDYYSQYPYVLTNAATQISAQTAQSSKVSIASANGGKRHHKDDEEYYGADGESEYEPAPYPSNGIERGWALTLLAKIKDVEQCIHDYADCHKSKTVEGGMIETVLVTYDTNCKTTAGNPVGAGIPVFIPGTSCAATNTPVPVCKWGSGKMKLRKANHDYYIGYGKEYKEYKPTPSYKEYEPKEEKKEKKVYKKDEKKY